MIIKASFYTCASIVIVVFQLACHARTTEALDDKNIHSGFSQTATDRKTLKHYRQIWEKNEPSQYKYKFSCECQCSFSTYYSKETNDHGAKGILRGKWIQIEVKDGKLIAAYLEDGSQDDKFIQNTSGENPLTHLFRLVEAGIETGMKKLEITYNQEKGFIEKASLDFTGAIDDESECLIKDYEIIAR